MCARSSRRWCPAARVVDVDTATADVPDADILIGTEAVLHRAAVRRRRPALVAYLDLDQELLAPRYRAASQAHWLLTRGAQLLAGRPAPRDPAVVADPHPRSRRGAGDACAANPRPSPRAEIDYRRTLAYPPFGALAELSRCRRRARRDRRRAARGAHLQTRGAGVRAHRRARAGARGRLGRARRRARRGPSGGPGPRPGAGRRRSARGSDLGPECGLARGPGSGGENRRRYHARRGDSHHPCLRRSGPQAADRRGHRHRRQPGEARRRHVRDDARRARCRPRRAAGRCAEALLRLRGPRRDRPARAAQPADRRGDAASGSTKRVASRCRASRSRSSARSS